MVIPISFYNHNRDIDMKQKVITQWDYKYNYYRKLNKLSLWEYLNIKIAHPNKHKYRIRITRPDPNKFKDMRHLNDIMYGKYVSHNKDSIILNKRGEIKEYELKDIDYMRVREVKKYNV